MWQFIYYLFLTLFRCLKITCYLIQVTLHQYQKMFTYDNASERKMHLTAAIHTK